MIELPRLEDSNNSYDEGYVSVTDSREEEEEEISEEGNQDISESGAQNGSIQKKKKKKKKRSGAKLQFISNALHQ